MRTSLLIILTFFIINVNAQQVDSLSLNANAIIQNYSVEINVINKTSAILKKRIIITVLNENGERHGEFAEYYDQFRKIKSFHGTILDADYDVLYKIKLKDLNDRSMINNFSLYEDNRIKFYVPEIKQYPYHVDYIYEIDLKNILNIPTWQPINSANLSLKKGSLKITSPINDTLKYSALNIDSPTISNIENLKIHNWEIGNIPARQKESLRLPYSYTTPSIKIAPSYFEVDGYSGNMISWEKFGKWFSQLNKDKEILPPNALSDINRLVNGIDNEIEKVKIIYEYMQSRTRYVSIQAGIGGWQPFDATTVHNLGYGDCKALANYTKSLLKLINIESNYALIKAGVNNSDIQTDFPSNQFNHAILCVPLTTDTIWLECTSQTAPFGYLGDFTGNKHALLITEDGGKIVKTTQYNKEENLQSRHISINILNNGDADALIKTSYEGFQYKNISYYAEKSKADQKELLLKKLELNNFTINEFHIDVKKDINPIAKDSIQVSIKKYATTSSSRMFFHLNALNKNEYIPKKTDQRISPIQFTYAYTDIDSIEYIIPSNYSIEYLPKSIELRNQFGDYSIDVKSQDNKIVYVRKLSMNKNVFPSNDYADLIVFFEEISKYDNSKCVLKIN
jgi:hypothetical protein